VNSDTKFIIDYSIDITLSSLKTYVIILDINEKLGVDLLIRANSELLRAGG
jgi:hypothetical protein